MTITEKYPITLKDRLELGLEEQVFEGSLEEFAALAEACEYPLEYEQGKIIAMSIASDIHERIVANLLGVLFLLFKEQKEYIRYGSNRHIYLPEFQCAYSPDASVVKGEPEVFEYAPGKTANVNPWLLVEVLSESTRDKDLGKKLPRYKKIGSLQYILFIEQDAPLVTLHHRMEDPSRWASLDYNRLEQSFQLGGHAVSLADVYGNVPRSS